ncbi:hypothetical protein A2U01_0047525, partial [Trifolium medium]|nr:hypothetical protein [Trifolium medium]
DSEDDQPASKGKDTVGTEGAFDAQVVKGKEPIVFGTAAATAPKKKRNGKEKIEVVVKEKKKRVAASVSDKEIVTKKQRTQKKRAPRRKFMVHEEEDEETDEEPLQSKRKRIEPEAKKMSAEADAGKSHFNEDDVLNSQAQNQPEIDLDPALLQPLNIAYPAQTSDLPPITSETDLDSVA